MVEGIDAETKDAPRIGNGPRRFAGWMVDGWIEESKALSALELKA